MNVDTGQLSPSPGPHRQSRQAIIFRLAALFQTSMLMTLQTTKERTGFSLICINCDAVGIVFDCAEDAPSSTTIKGRHCGAPRGTLGDLRRLSISATQDVFEI
jgi:hypothetical protein